MKKTFYLFIFLCNFNTTFCQINDIKTINIVEQNFNNSNYQIDTNILNTSANKDFFIQRCKKFNTIGTILLGVGLTSIIVPLAIPESDKYKGSYGFDATKVVFVFGGVLTSLISIPYFISGNNNKKKAINIGIARQTYIITPKTEYVSDGLCFSFKLNL